MRCRAHYLHTDATTGLGVVVTFVGRKSAGTVSAVAVPEHSTDCSVEPRG